MAQFEFAARNPSVMNVETTPATCHGELTQHICIAHELKRDYHGLVTLLTRRARDRALAEDMVHEAFLLSLDKLATDRIADRTRFFGYVYRVALNLMRNHRRKHENRADLHSGLAVLDTIAGSRDADATEIDPTFVQTVLAELSTARDREILTRFYLKEESKDAICASLGLSAMHFDKVVFRARRRMRMLLEARGWSGAAGFSATSVQEELR